VTGDWPLQIGLEDWIAHLHEDLVEEFVSVVAQRSEVAEAIHEDRETISIRTRSPLSPETLGRFAHAWFTERLPDGPLDEDD
jgi:hypothetical protein